MPFPNHTPLPWQNGFLGAFSSALLLGTIVLGSWAPSPVAGSEEGPLSVFATVVPLATFVERIGGDQVRVQPMVRAGQNPHTYDPTPRQVAALADADLYVRVGMSLEDAWLPRIRATNPRMQIVDARDGLPLRQTGPVQELDAPQAPGVSAGPGKEREDDEHEHDPGGHEGHTHDPDAQDTHIWTSPSLAKSMGAGIRDALIRLRPGQAGAFKANYARFAADLDTLDAEIRARLAPVKQRRFMVFHPAWGYFADTYGLTQVAVEFQGKEPGARALAGLIDRARADDIRVVLVQPQMSPRSAEQIATAIGGRVESVDPLSADYFGTLRQLAELIAGASDQ